MFPPHPGPYQKDINRNILTNSDVGICIRMEHGKNPDWTASRIEHGFTH